MGAGQLEMNPSKTLLRTAVKEMGLRSEPIDRGRVTFPKGKISAKQGDAPLSVRTLEEKLQFQLKFPIYTSLVIGYFYFTC